MLLTQWCIIKKTTWYCLNASLAFTFSKKHQCMGRIRQDSRSRTITCRTLSLLLVLKGITLIGIIDLCIHKSFSLGSKFNHSCLWLVINSPVSATVRRRWVGKCLDLQGLPWLVNDEFINIVSVLPLVYTHLPRGRDRKHRCRGQ